MSMDEPMYPLIGEFEIEGNSALAQPSVDKKGFLGLQFYTAVALSRTAIAPIDRVKLLLQNQTGMIFDGRLSEPYKGFRNCFWRTAMEEGFASLWRGNVANLIRYVPAQAITFGIWGYCKSQFSEIDFRRDEVGYYDWFRWNSSVGMVAGGCSMVIVHPMDYAWTRLAIDAKKGGERQLKGLFDLCRKTLAAEGIAGFYRGVGLSFIGALGYRGFYFGTYGSLKPVVLTGKMQDSFFGSFALAWVSATVAGSVMYPIDITRRRMMVMPGEYQSPGAAIWQSCDGTSGLRAAFRGAGANIPRAIAGAAMLAAYDTNLNFKNRENYLLKLDKNFVKNKKHV